MKRILLSITAVLVVSLGALPSPARAAFGFEKFDVQFLNEDGSPATQAGSHPFAMTTEFFLNHHTDPSSGEDAVDAEPRDLTLGLPAGFVGRSSSTPFCRTADFLRLNP